ncbi:MAG TPA: primosomal protein N', partial [Lysobacter sp.]|nr:primosomal protein N' [Lysobacter sp.]
MPASTPPPDAIWRVALPVPLPRLFDYRPAAGSAMAADVGCRVRAPFGSRELVGLIAAVGSAETDVVELKTAERLDAAPLFHGELLDSLRWLARYTHAPLGEVFATALPAPLRQGDPLAETHSWAWRLNEAGRTALARLRG